MKLFERVVELIVGDTKISGLDISFEIEKDLSPEPNPCHIEIFNLGEKNRAILSSHKRVPVLLKAGYKDQMGVIFQGDMISCTHEKVGPTWKTLLATGDGVAAIQTARINKTFSKGTPIKTVIKEMVKQLGMPSKNALAQLEAFKKNDKLERGFTVSGNPMDELCRVLRQYGYSASVQSNNLQVIKQGQALNKQAINLTADSGLKGTPEVGSDKKIQAQAVLMPELLPGQMVHIESAVFKGFATIQSVRFTGANFGDNWETEITATII
jgi:hypothetical protein